MIRINFKRKKGGKGGWGAGLDYLLKEYWDKLDSLVKDNYFGKHDPKLIDFLFSKIIVAISKSIEKMKMLCAKDSSGLGEWINKAKKIQKLADSSALLNEKVIFIDTAIQFLRATSVRDKKKTSKRKITKRNKRGQIKGSVASCAGKKIRGTAKIVLNKKDFSKIKKGEILITKETDSDFLPVMKKAAAFVVDFGGLLCHAAIIARELKKICVVHTRIATNILRDGDLVEIDTKQGIVKII
jgi:phosphoenolpyruvate synthase/pyruvate phosphate dikinase